MRKLRILYDQDTGRIQSVTAHTDDELPLLLQQVPGISFIDAPEGFDLVDVPDSPYGLTFVFEEGELQIVAAEPSAEELEALKAERMIEVDTLCIRWSEADLSLPNSSAYLEELKESERQALAYLDDQQLTAQELPLLFQDFSDQLLIGAPEGYTVLLHAQSISAEADHLRLRQRIAKSARRTIKAVIAGATTVAEIDTAVLGASKENLDELLEMNQ